MPATECARLKGSTPFAQALSALGFHRVCRATTLSPMRRLIAVEPGRPLIIEEVPEPEPGLGEVLLAVEACGVCRTDLHLRDGELPMTHYPVVPGHQVVGRVVCVGEGVDSSLIGKRVGVSWLATTCERCEYCTRGEENLCPEAEFTGCHRDGGFAELCTARAGWVLPIPEHLSSLDAAPLLCAGLIGYRAYRMALRSTATVEKLGLYGFGSAAHLLAQIARFDGRRVFALTRPQDRPAQELALSLGAAWAGDTDPPEPLDAALLFAPAGELVPRALAHVRKGGAVICAGIHMSDIPSFPYRLLWGERTVRSVANVTREDAQALFERLRNVELKLAIHPYPLEAAEQALGDLREGRFSGSAVLVVKQGARC